MFRFLRQHRALVMISVTLSIVGLLLFQAGGYSFMESTLDTAFKVNGEKITQGEFDRVYKQILRQRQNTTPPPSPQQVAQMTFQQIVRDRVFYEEAKRYGVELSDQELKVAIASAPAFQREGQFDPETYARVVTQVIGSSIDDFETMERRDLIIQHLHSLIASTVQISDEQVEAAMAAGEGKDEKDEDETEKDQKPLTPQERFEKIRQDLRDKELNRVYSNWLTQLNAKLRVTPPSEALQRRLSGGPAQ